MSRRITDGELEKLVLSAAAATLRELPSALDIDSDLPALGFESIGITELASHLGKELGVHVSTALLFEAKTLRDVVKHLEGLSPSDATPNSSIDTTPDSPVEARASAMAASDAEVQTVAPGVTAPVDTPVKHRWELPMPEPGKEEGREIAVIGMAGVFPGAHDVDQLWEMLVRGEDAFDEVPTDRWDWRSAVANGEPYARWAALISDVWRFDAEFFGITPREAELMDPQQRLLLEVVWAAIEDGGYPHLQASNTGLFVGVSTNDYVNVIRDSGQVPVPQTTTGNFHSTLANRISHLLDLRGPSEPVDTACSSSLVALARAVLSLRAGECETAIVGGVNALLHPDVFVSFGKAGMLSSNGRCKPFAAGADGYVRGEGAAALLLKPLASAMRDGDRVHGIIRGVAVNHCGRGRSMTTPDPVAQAAVVRRAWADAAVDPRSIGYVEAHGTGTRLGDPIEIRGLNRAFRELAADAGVTMAKGICRVGGIKGNIGHLEAAAGLAGVVKILLCMRHETLPGQLHLATPNADLELDDGPFALLPESVPWTRFEQADGTPAPLRAGVSSFGFGGVNAHVALEEYSGVRLPRTHASNELVVLSTRTERSLHEAARRLSVWLSDKGANTSLTAISHTLATGRVAFEHRLAIVASSVPELQSSLSRFLDGTPDDRTFSGCAAADPAWSRLLVGSESFLSDLWRAGELTRLAELVVRGTRVDWRAVRSRALGPEGVVSLPTYPFGGEQHRVGPPLGRIGRATHGELAGLVSRADLAVRMSGRRGFSAGHWVAGASIVAGAAQLLASLEGFERVSGKVVRFFHDVCWIKPLQWSEDETRTLHLAFELEEDGSARVTAHAGDAAHASACFHAKASIVEESMETVTRHRSANADGPLWAVDRCYEALEAHGLTYEGPFRTLRGVTLSERETTGSLRAVGPGWGLAERAGVLDGALQAAVLAAAHTGAVPEGTPVPGRARRVTFYAPLERECVVYVSPACEAGEGLTVDVVVANASGRVLVRFDGLSIVGLQERERTSTPPAEIAKFLFRAPHWLPARRGSGPGTTQPQAIVVFTEDDARWRALSSSGGRWIRVRRGPAFSLSEDGSECAVTSERSSIKALFDALISSGSTEIGCIHAPTRLAPERDADFAVRQAR